MTPGPKSRSLARRLARVESRNITYLSDDFPIFWESARGSRVRDVDGNSYLDLTSAFGVASLGHGSPAVARALKNQAARLWHGMGDVHPSSVKVELLETLARITPGRLEKTILSNSGAEAVESALKTARLATGRPGFLAFEGGYHGLTYGALHGTHRADFRKPFLDQLRPIATHLPFPDSLRGPTEEKVLERADRLLRSRAGARLGAILVEPIQGRGGIRVPRAFFLRELQALARRRGLLFIIDEIWTGFGRTGKLFALEHSGAAPDLLCLGKAMANGFPISACIGTRRVMDAWPRSDGEAIHTSTFLGNPLGCAMALASIREMQRLDLAERSARLGRQWKAQLQATLGDHPRVAEIRGEGLMIGIELVKDRTTLEPDASFCGRLIAKALRHGLLLLGGGNSRNVLSLTPPLTIRPRDLSRATQILVALLTE